MLDLSGSIFVAFVSIVFCAVARLGAIRYAEDIRQCPMLEPRYYPPKDITDLRPDDIKVIMALGDSVTAGFGAKLFTMFETKILQEYRGLSFSMGGDPNVPTIANFIKHYQPELIGASRGTHLVELCFGGVFCAPDELTYRPQQDVFNAALTGAISATLGMETKYLLKQISKNPFVNVTTDWKMLTLFIGTNEICKTSCEDREEGAPGTATDFEHRVSSTLLLLHQRLPRTLVNIILLPDMSQVEYFARNHPRCMHTKRFLSSICQCSMNFGDAGRWAMRRATAEYNSRLIRLAHRVNSYAKSQAQSQGLPLEFAVMISPLLRDMDIRTDIPAHFAAKLDCFHPSATAHRSMAIALWF